MEGVPVETKVRKSDARPAEKKSAAQQNQLGDVRRVFRTERKCLLGTIGALWCRANASLALAIVAFSVAVVVLLITCGSERPPSGSQQWVGYYALCIAPAALLQAFSVVFLRMHRHALAEIRSYHKLVLSLSALEACNALEDAKPYLVDILSRIHRNDETDRADQQETEQDEQSDGKPTKDIPGFLMKVGKWGKD